MMSDDPFVRLGLARTASVADIRAARRRLARELHPDVGGDAIAMRDLNAAVDAAVAHATGRRVLADGGAPAPPAATTRTTTSPPRRPRDERPRDERRSDERRSDRGGTQVDEWSFVIEALPAEAFEALLVVTSWVGEVLVDDPPYLLEVHLHDPSPCWCRLTLVPDAGSSTVSLVVAQVGDTPAPDVEAVRDMWVDQINRL
jgi:curved DNA-binding protein CbpA